ncbi:hypothetical protein AJ80_00371 [Polytolypa hystricis UAMH7299]|uniref:Uncharacterized protein n=1 Tax=Polytolypa hystricis (strain UAMH7299) TaxID=1447883 RepID=A0A2B7Z383_POLH7|nr:hypothetical protein AJ80_00371 [Polytolypa hystricis UAMH7299]
MRGTTSISSWEPRLRQHLVLLLDLYQEREKVLEAFNLDGYIFKGSAETAIQNRERIFRFEFDCIEYKYVLNSLTEKATIDCLPQWKELSEKTEVVALTCFHLHSDDNSRWEWEYDLGGLEIALGQTKAISANGRDVYVKERPGFGFNDHDEWLASDRLPRSKGEKIDLYQLNYLQKDYKWN